MTNYRVHCDEKAHVIYDVQADSMLEARQLVAEGKATKMALDEHTDIEITEVEIVEDRL